jgi:hypothetical protein
MAAIAAAALALASCAPKPLKEYSYPAWGFAVSYRAPPTVSDTPASAKDGTPRTFHVEGQESGRDFVVDVEDAANANQTPAQMIAAVPDAIVASSGGTIVAHSNVTLGGVTGNDVTIDRGAGAPAMRVRVFYANTKLYQINAQSSKGADDKEVTDFFNSFRFLGH